MRLRFHTLDVFTSRRLAGNPLAVVLGADALDGATMQSDRARVQSQRDGVRAGAARSGEHRAHPHLHAGGGAALRGPSDGRRGGAARPAARARGAGAPRRRDRARGGGRPRCAARSSRAAAAPPSRDSRRRCLPARGGEPPGADVIAAALGLAPTDIGFRSHRPSLFSAGVEFLLSRSPRARRSIARGPIPRASPPRSARRAAPISIRPRRWRRAAPSMRAPSPMASASPRIRRRARPRPLSPASRRRSRRRRTASMNSSSSRATPWADRRDHPGLAHRGGPPRRRDGGGACGRRHQRRAGIVTQIEPFAFELLTVERLHCVVADHDWAFDRLRADEIDAHWAQRKAANPALYDGPVLLAHRVERRAEADGSATLRRRIFPHALFPLPRLAGFRLSGRRACATASPCRRCARPTAPFCSARWGRIIPAPGAIYFPAGTPDPSDLRDGLVDLEDNLLRELREETGVAPQEVRLEPRLDHRASPGRASPACESPIRPRRRPRWQRRVDGLYRLAGEAGARGRAHGVRGAPTSPSRGCSTSSAAFLEPLLPE